MREVLKAVVVAVVVATIMWGPLLLYRHLNNNYKMGVKFNHWVTTQSGAMYYNPTFFAEPRFHNTLVLKRLGITIHDVPAERVTEECCQDGCTSDRGASMPSGSAQACEIKHADGLIDIWIPSEDVRPVLLHELAHADGSYTDAEVDEMFP